VNLVNPRRLPGRDSAPLNANEDWRIKNIPALAETAKEARAAREEWMRLARREVDRV
jgi:hypothetical protein